MVLAALSRMSDYYSTMKTLILCLLATSAPMCLALQPATQPEPAKVATAAPGRVLPGAKVFLEPMDGFENYLAAALLDKKVPVVVVDDKAKADYTIGGVGEIQDALISGRPHASASITVKDVKSGGLVFAYAVDKTNAFRGSQSTAQACAKHLKEFIEKGPKS